MKSRHYIYWVVLIALIAPFTVSVNDGTITYQMKIYDNHYLAILWILVAIMILDFAWARYNEQRQRLGKI